MLEGREKRRLIAAMLEGVLEVGPEAMTLDRVARRTGMHLEDVARHYPDVPSLLHDSVDHVVRDTIVRAIEDLPEGLSASARLGLFCHRLWAALLLPGLAAVYRLAQTEHDRVATLERLLGELALARARSVVRKLVADAQRSGEIRMDDGAQKADRIVTLLFAHGFWHHYPELFGLPTAEPADEVVPHVLLVTLGRDNQRRVLLAARGRPSDGRRR